MHLHLLSWGPPPLRPPPPFPRDYLFSQAHCCCLKLSLLYLSEFLGPTYTERRLIPGGLGKWGLGKIPNPNNANVTIWGRSAPDSWDRQKGNCLGHPKHPAICI